MSNTDPQQPPTQQPQPGYQPQAGYQPPPAPRRLTRAADDKMVAGVCGGLARYANVDATLVRVLTVVVGIFTFPVSLLAYVVLWLVMPGA